MESTKSAPETDVRVQFLAFAGCPLAEAAREALDKAIVELALSEYEEVDILDPATAEELRGWGSPTILVNGIDVTGTAKGDGAGCRIYSTASRVPETALIVRRIIEARQCS